MPAFSTKIPLSLYIHIPWCVRKCPYCDFNSHEARQDVPEEAYVAALLDDLDTNLHRIAGRELVSIFFGGGTPSLFSPSAIEKILTGVQKRVPFGSQIEITLEANPGTVDTPRFTGFRHAGVNRLSIGVQSLQNDKLQALGRIHDRDHALRAIEAVTEAGFNNYNLDLMHGLPNQSIPDALQDLTDALGFQPPHLSWYQLTIEPNTLFHHKPPTLPEENTLGDIQDLGAALITQAGLTQYEVSAFAKPQHQCRHNRNYWEFGDYIGIGAGAHSKVTDLEHGTVTRYWQVKNPKDYLAADKSFTARETILTEQDLCFEFMLNALRLTNGVSSTLFTERTGLSFSSLEPHLSTARTSGLLLNDPTLLCPTLLGHRFLNDLIGLFLPERA